MSWELRSGNLTSMLKFSLRDSESKSPNFCRPESVAMWASKMRAVMRKSVSLVTFICLGIVSLFYCCFCYVGISLIYCLRLFLR